MNTRSGEATGNDLLSWACGRWRTEVQDRPLVNKNRRTLDDTWRQVVRYAGGNPDELLVEIGRRATPCGECHLQPGERCDICGARDVRG